ncbi:collagen alpha-1(I) chain-like [Polyodon spathula]|uniref:collagen alpha-1(I) chain-like n=1 Tax=Polyodon spathula TaxID=7913 RepID=UPI001B7E8E56|nr:collagen alpha-1(I) chain-like [Polyodon spathula]
MGTARREIYTLSPGFSRTGEGSPGRRRSRDAFQGAGPYLGANPFQGRPQPFTKKRELFPGPPPASPGSSAPAAAPPGPSPQGFCAHRGGPPTRRGVAPEGSDCAAGDGRVWARRCSAIHFQGRSIRQPTSPQTPGATAWTVPRPATRRGQAALRTVRAQSTVAPGAGGPGPSPPRVPDCERVGVRCGRGREGAAAGLVPRPRRAAVRGGGGYNARRGVRRATFPKTPGPCRAGPEPVAAHRRGGSASDGEAAKGGPPRAGWDVGGLGEGEAGPRPTATKRRAPSAAAAATSSLPSPPATRRPPPARAFPGPRHPAGLNPPGGLRGPHPFTSRRFHALLNSLFKVLFNFPSRYLFAIGLVPVFSLRWSLPPALGCIHKQPDSEKTRTRRDGGLHRPDTVCGSLDQKGLGPHGRRRERGLLYATFRAPAGAGGDSALGSSLFTRRYWGNPESEAWQPPGGGSRAAPPRTSVPRRPCGAGTGDGLPLVSEGRKKGSHRGNGARRPGAAPQAYEARVSDDGGPERAFAAPRRLGRGLWGVPHPRTPRLAAPSSPPNMRRGFSSGSAFRGTKGSRVPCDATPSRARPHPGVGRDGLLLIPIAGPRKSPALLFFVTTSPCREWAQKLPSKVDRADIRMSRRRHGGGRAIGPRLSRVTKRRPGGKTPPRTGFFFRSDKCTHRRPQGPLPSSSSPGEGWRSGAAAGVAGAACRRLGDSQETARRSRGDCLRRVKAFTRPQVGRATNRDTSPSGHSPGARCRTTATAWGLIGLTGKGSCGEQMGAPHIKRVREIVRKGGGTTVPEHRREAGPQGPSFVGLRQPIVITRRSRSPGLNLPARDLQGWPSPDGSGAGRGQGTHSGRDRPGGRRTLGERRPSGPEPARRETSKAGRPLTDLGPDADEELTLEGTDRAGAEHLENGVRPGLNLPGARPPRPAVP